MCIVKLLCVLLSVVWRRIFYDFNVSQQVAENPATYTCICDGSNLWHRDSLFICFPMYDLTRISTYKMFFACPMRGTDRNVSIQNEFHGVLLIGYSLFSGEMASETDLSMHTDAGIPLQKKSCIGMNLSFEFRRWIVCFPNKFFIKISSRFYFRCYSSWFAVNSYIGKQVKR